MVVTLFNPASTTPFRLSRSKIDLFVECRRCFYLDRRTGATRPPSPPFTLNIAIDELLKREFDTYRASGTPHPLMVENGLDAVPFTHDQLDAWRDSLHRGVRAVHEPTGFEVTGGIDDVWVDSAGRLIVVDYKATAKQGKVSLDAPWQDRYRRQVEVYQWLFRQNGFEVADTAYFVYVNGDLSAAAFDNRLSFSPSLLPHVGNTDWIVPALEAARATLSSDVPPEPTPGCKHCVFLSKAGVL